MRPMSRLLMFAVIVFCSVGLFSAAQVTNLSGRWDMMMNPDFKGKPSIEHCRMKHQNRRLTVICGDHGAAMLGEVNGQKVVWKFTSQDHLTAVWSGELDRSASNISGTWQLTFADGDKRRGEFTARKLRE